MLDYIKHEIVFRVTFTSVKSWLEIYWLSTKHLTPPTVTAIEFLNFCFDLWLCTPVWSKERKKEKGEGVSRHQKRKLSNDNCATHPSIIDRRQGEQFWLTSYAGYIISSSPKSLFPFPKPQAQEKTIKMWWWCMRIRPSGANACNIENINKMIKKKYFNLLLTLISRKEKFKLWWLLKIKPWYQAEVIPRKLFWVFVHMGADK